MSTKIITVDYSKSLSEMIEAGNYDSINKNIISDHFPIIGTGKVKLEMVCDDNKYGLIGSIENTADELERYKFRHANLAELLAYDLKTHREYRSYSRLVALGSKTLLGNRWFAPYLRESSPERGLSLMWADVGHSDNHNFLGVREIRPKGQEEVDKKCLESCKEKEKPEYGPVETRLRVAHRVWRISGFILVIAEEHKWGKERNLPNRGRIESSNAIYVFDLEGNKFAESRYDTFYWMNLPSGRTENRGKNHFLEIKSFSLETMYAEVKSGFPMANELHSVSIKVYPVTT